MAHVGITAPETSLRSGLAQRWTPSVFIFTVVLGVVGFLVLYPLLVLFLKSFETSQFGVSPSTVGFANWQVVLTEPRMLDAIKNTFTLALTRQVIALLVGIGLAWGIARTNVPWPNWLAFGFWISLFLPTLSVLLGWIILFDGSNGLLNNALVDLVPFIDAPPFEIFSWWGIVFAHLMTGTLAIHVMLLVPAIKNMDGVLEDASVTLGAGKLTTLWRVVVPGITPTLVLVTLLGLIRSLDAFEIELILGARDNVEIYSTVIFKEVVGAQRFGDATALAMLFLAVLVPLIVLQRWVAGRPSQSTIKGTHPPALQDLGRGRWLVFGVIATVLLFMTVIPVLLVMLGTFMKVFGSLFVDSPLTLENWKTLASNSETLNALRTSLFLGLGSSVLAMTVFTVIGYIAVRTNFWGKQVLGHVAWLPSTMPGMIMSLGFVWLFLQLGLFGDYPYQSIWALIIAVALGGITLGVQIIKSSMVQLGAELEEASWAAGAGPFYTFRRIVLPLIAPAVVVVGVLTFATAMRATSIVALLATGESKPLSLLQLDHMADGDFGEAAVIGVFLVVLITGVALVGRVFGLKVGLGGGR